jgi:hypothetical protein
MLPSPDLLDVLRALYGAMSSGNPGSVESFYSVEHGSIFVGTDDSEFWIDSTQHNEDVRPYFDGSHGQLDWHCGEEPAALVEGTVGWCVDRPIVRLPDGSVLRPRLTLVWHREGNIWRVVHSHASLGMHESI